MQVNAVDAADAVAWPLPLVVLQQINAGEIRPLSA
jgi:hypothetical protein